MYDKLLLFVIPLLFILGISSTQNASAIVQVDLTNLYLNDSGNLIPYKLTDSLNSVKIQTKEGSYVFDKTSCSLSFWNGTNTDGTPIINSDAYSVLASQGNTGVWNPVNLINNASCNTSVSESNNSVTITGTKSVVGAGVFIINYTKSLTSPLKLTFSAKNTNPSWTNYHIGMQEKLQVPRYVKLGNMTYDLSQYNGTVLNRNWITNHNSKLIHLTDNTHYDMGIGWNNVSQVSISWINNKAYLTIDYTYNTPILSPNNTITIDPSINVDTTQNTQLDNVDNPATTTVSITVGSHSNRALIAVIGDKGGSADANPVTSVKVGSTSFTRIIKQQSSDNIQHNEIWYLLNPSTGSNTVTVTWSGTTGLANYGTVGVYSLYNVDQSSPVGATNSTTGNPPAATTLSNTIIPQKSDSILIASNFVATGTAGSGITSLSDTTAWNNLPGAQSLAIASQYVINATGGTKHAFTMKVPGSSNVFDLSVAEIKTVGTGPAAPSLTHANTLSSTAIQLDWGSSTGATGYLVYQASPYTGAYSLISNQTLTTLTVNSLTSGTQYGFKVASFNSSGTSSYSTIKSNYTYNIAATSPTISGILYNGARLSWTNPASANLTGGFVIYKVTAVGTNYTTEATTSNNTNHYDLSSLFGNREYSLKLSTRYAVGTNYSGLSSNSTIVSFYTVPGTPTGLTATQTSALNLHLSWTPASDNGTVTGTKIERSSNGGTSWTVITSSTGNATTTYNTSVPSAGTYLFRVSTIKYGGTSSPSTSASILVWDVFTVREYHADNVTPVYGQAIQSNLTSSNNRFALTSGAVTINGLSALNNFTAWNSLINFIVGKQYNYNTTAHSSINMTTNDYNIDCPFTGTGDDVELWTNGTNAHQITHFSTPVCLANDTVTWKTDFTPDGKTTQSFNTAVYVKILNATFLNTAPLKYNSTIISTALSDPYVVSAPVTVGSGTTSGIKTFYWSMNLTVSPGFIPVNFTVGHISVSGTNPVTAPIKFSANTINTTATAVTVTFPSTYTMAYDLTFGNAGNHTTLTGLPVTNPSLGLSASTIIFRNPANDMVTIRAYDTASNTTASYILAQPNSSIPFVTQILAFKNGAFGTSAMIGGIDIVTLIILIVAMVGLNRVNETVGAVLMIMIIGGCAYFGIIQWPTVMTAAIALVVLVIVSTTKKLPWS